MAGHYVAGMESWIVARLKPSSLAVASLNLRRQGFLIYSPSFRASKLLNGKPRHFLDPLFPGYLFVRASLVPGNDSPESLPFWAPIKSTRGVASVLMLSHDKPAPIIDSFVEELKSRERGGAIDPAPLTKHRRGERLRIRGGIYAGLDALYQSSARASDREIVLLSIMGRMTRVEIASADL